jgi:hypothetical protein
MLVNTLFDVVVDVDNAVINFLNATIVTTTSTSTKDP